MNTDETEEEKRRRNVVGFFGVKEGEARADAAFALAA